MAATRPEHERTLEQIVSRGLAPEAAAAIATLLEEVTVEHVVAALAVLREHGPFEDVVSSLGAHHPDELLDAILPGHSIDPEVDVRLWTSLKYEPDWMGDLRIAVHKVGGLGIVVGSRVGAEALRRLGRDLRARIVSVSIRERDGEDRRAIEPLLAAIAFDGVTSLRADEEMEGVLARWILNCPALEEFIGPVTDPAVLDALATSAVRSIYADRTSPDSLGSLARCQWLATLYLSDEGFRSTGLGSLASYPALRELHVGRSDLRPGEFEQLLQIGGLEELYVGGCPIDDARGPALATLRRLHTLDLHGTQVGDRTVEALVALPLERLDLSETAITIAAIHALRRCTTLRQLGLAWSLPDDVTRAANALEIDVHWNDYHSGGSALWGAGYHGP